MKNLVSYLEDYLDENEEVHFKGPKKKINEEKKLKFSKRNKDKE
jgi:hypothetical protein